MMMMGGDDDVDGCGGCGGCGGEEQTNACRASVQSLQHSHKPQSGLAEVATAVTSGVGGCAQRGGACFFLWLLAGSSAICHTTAGEH